MESTSSRPDNAKAGKDRFGILWLLFVAAIGGASIGCQEKGGPSNETRAAPDIAPPPDQLALVLDNQRQALARSLDEGTLPDTDAALGKVREQVEKSSTDGSEAEKAVAIVASGYLELVQELTNAHKASIQNLIEANVFAFKVKDREMTAAHKDLLQDFSASNGNLVAAITQRESAMRAGFEDAELPPEEIEKIVAGISATAERTAETELLIRECDQALAEAAIKVLDVMDKNWDILTLAKENGDTTAEQTDLWKQIGDQVMTIKKISEYQVAIQKKFIGSVNQNAKGR